MDRRNFLARPMTVSATTADAVQQSLVHLHTASLSLVPQSQSVSSFLVSKLLSTVAEKEITLAESYIESRFCQRCGTAYVAGVTCHVRSAQSRRQRRMRKDWWWVTYECKLCTATF